jgi:DNA-binding CsgD family transcriptional regulator
MTCEHTVDVVDVGSGRRFVAAVAQANDFVEVAKLVCAEATLLGADACTVSHQAASGQPVVAVDNRADHTDDIRLSWVGDFAWRRDPLHLAMLARGSVVQVSQAGAEHTLLIPIVEPRGVLGSIRCVSHAPLSCDVERELLTVAAMAAVQLAYLGITSLASDNTSVRLTPRQRDVAELATLGLTNGEIAGELGISLNTVKNRLKEAFDRLAVRSRVELVGALTRASSALDVPFGVSRDGLFAIARGPIGPGPFGSW